MRRFVLCLLIVDAVCAAEQRGQVLFGGLALPGATITATQSEKVVTAVTDLQGSYVLPQLSGDWTVRVEMLCFAPLERGVKAGENTTWDLQLLPLEEILKTAAPPQPATFKKTELTEQRAPVKAAEKAEAATTVDAGQSADAFGISGSVNNGAAVPFGQSAAFGNFRKNANGVYRGGLGLTLDNSALDARTYSLTGQDTAKAAYNRLQANISFGGPVRIPHFIKDDKTQFFFNYQFIRNRNAVTSAYLVPTLEQRAITPIASQAKALLSYYPVPNFASNGRYNYQTALRNSVHTDAINTRLNRGIGNKDQVYGTFAWQRGSTLSTDLFGFDDAGQTSGWNAAANWQHRFNQKMIFHTQYQLSRSTNELTPNFAGKTNVSGAAGILGNNQEPGNWGPPRLIFSTGIASLGDAQRSLDRNQTHALGADMFWNRRVHNITFGADYKRVQFNALSQQDPRGTFTFAGNDFVNFANGIPDTTSIAYGNADKYFRQPLYDAYFTDDWRMSASLSINAGGRWEYAAPLTEKYGRLVNLAITENFRTATPLVGAKLQPDRLGFQPRIGVSYRPIAGSSMVVRSGYGLYRNTSVYQSIVSQMAQQSPLSTTLSIQNSLENPITLANGFPLGGLTGRNTFAVDPNFRVGFAHNWNLSVQRDLPGSLVMTATYLGIKGTRAIQKFLPNTVPNGATNPCPACPNGFVYLASNGNTTRESLQLQLRRRLRAGVTASLNYTFSKSIDNTGTVAQNWLDLRGERGLSNFDQRHLLSATTQYSSGAKLRNRLVKDWTLTTQTTYGSGLPLTPTYFAAVQGTGITGSIRPDFTGATLYTGVYPNPLAFAAPKPGHWGNAGRNTITGPNQFALNASLGRSFRITDRFNADFRFDSTNALNHVNFGAWNTNMSSTQFGLPTTPSPMRILQANLRVRF